MNQLLELLMDPRPGDRLAQWRANGQLAAFLPEVDALYGVEQNPDHHPEICTGIHTQMCLDVASLLNGTPAARFAVLTHDLGKALTPKAELPKHVDHELRGLVPVEAVCARLGVPDDWRRVALLVCEHHLNAHRAFEMRSKSMLKLLNETGLESDHTLLEDFLVACEADKRGRLGKESKPYDQGLYIRAAAQSLQAIPMQPGTLVMNRETQDLHRARLEAVRNAGAPFRAAREALKSPDAVEC